VITDGIELFQLFERETPDGQTTYLVGMLGSAAVAIVPDDARPGVWRVLLTDPTQAGRRDRGASLRSIAPPPSADDGPHYADDMNDDIPADFDSLLPVSADAPAAPCPAADPSATEPPGAQPQ
jgi:hypothetical protein